MDVRGQGAVPLTYPRRADAQLELPAGLDADVLVARLPARSVIAEVHKARGAPLHLALPSGRYRALVRLAGGVRSCSIELPVGAAVALDTGACAPAPGEDVWAKASRRSARDLWGLELVVGLGTGFEDGYTRRLEDFGYTGALFSRVQGELSLAASREIGHGLAIVLGADLFGGGSYSRPTDLEPLTLSWSTSTLGARLRAAHLVHKAAFFAEAGAGVAMGRTHFSDEAGRVTRETFFGPHVVAGAGVELRVWRHLGLILRGTWVWAPAIENLIGDTHDGGGLYLGLGVRARFN
jgi:hypothetical protein